jgi:alcohol dehydrogenase class IV
VRFEFATATRIIFGPGTLSEAGPLATAFGKRAFVVTGSSPDRAAGLLEQLNSQEIEAETFCVQSEPSTTLISEGVQRAREASCDVVFGLGGGSVIDAGKAISALLTNGGEPLDYLEVIGRGKPITKPSAPYIAVPTTSGTGAEVTRNAVLSSPEHKLKVSLRSAHMLPQVAIVDPEVTYSMPSSVTASTGLDALTQVMEPFVSHMANAMTDAICREGLARASRALGRAYADGTDAHAREDMALTSLMGGLALANAKLGAVHGFAGVIGGMYQVPHGVVCARLLPFVMEANVRALQERDDASPALTRYKTVAEILTGEPGATPADGVDWAHDLCEDLSVPRLSEFGISLSDFPSLVEKSQRSSSMKGNPIVLTEDELTAVLKQAI